MTMMLSIWKHGRPAFWASRSQRKSEFHRKRWQVATFGCETLASMSPTSQWQPWWITCTANRNSSALPTVSPPTTARNTQQPYSDNNHTTPWQQPSHSLQGACRLGTQTWRCVPWSDGIPPWLADGTGLLTVRHGTKCRWLRLAMCQLPK